MKLLFVLMMADYVLTFIGLDAGVIEEANPFMIWFTELSWGWALVVRLLMFLFIVYLPMKLANKFKEKPINESGSALNKFFTPSCRPAFVKWFYRIGIAVNLAMMFLHARWIILSNFFY